MVDSRPARLTAAVGRPGPVGGLHRGGFRSRQHSRATRSGPPPRDTARRYWRHFNVAQWSAMMVTSASDTIALEQHVSITVEEFHTLNRCLDTAIAEAVTEHSRLIAQRRSEESSVSGKPSTSFAPAQRCGPLRFTQASADRSSPSSSLRQRLLDRGGVALIGILHRYSDDRARLEIDVPPVVPPPCSSW